MMVTWWRKKASRAVLAKCPNCGDTLSEWFVRHDESKLFSWMFMYCYGGCCQISPWRTHAEFREQTQHKEPPMPEPNVKYIKYEWPSEEGWVKDLPIHKLAHSSFVTVTDVTDKVEAMLKEQPNGKVS